MEANLDKRADDLQQALIYAENIIATLREPFAVLDKSLRARTANAAFYRDFLTSKEETEGRLLYELGDGQGRKPDTERRRLAAQLRLAGLTLQQIGARLGITRQGAHHLLRPSDDRARQRKGK